MVLRKGQSKLLLAFDAVLPLIWSPILSSRYRYDGLYQVISVGSEREIRTARQTHHYLGLDGEGTQPWWISRLQVHIQGVLHG